MSSYRISSQASWSSTPVTKVPGWAWNIDGVDDKGISITGSWNAGCLEPPSAYIGAGGYCRGPAVGIGGDRLVRLEYNIITNPQ
jgi:hypothetical protein